MSHRFSLSLQACIQACHGQSFPQNALYMVATPIGNLADITLRALYVLQMVDVLACEDTRTTKQLLSAYGIVPKAHQRFISLHQHNEYALSKDIVEYLQSNLRVAYVSDAGTPAISDPGARLAAYVHDSGFQIIPIAGISSVNALLSVAGIEESSENFTKFEFFGFLPPKGAQRLQSLQNLAYSLKQKRAVVVLEAPHRIENLAKALAQDDFFSCCPLTLGRELTKQYEEIVKFPQSAQLLPWLLADKNRLRGEFSMVLHPWVSESRGSSTENELNSYNQSSISIKNIDAENILKHLLPHVGLKTAVQITVDITRGSRKEIYSKALQLKDEAMNKPME